MTKRQLQKLMRERKLKKGEYKVTYEPSADQRSVKLEFESLQTMTALDFLLILVDWTNDFAVELYLKAENKAPPVEYEADDQEH